MGFCHPNWAIFGVNRILITECHGLGDFRVFTQWVRPGLMKMSQTELPIVIPSLFPPFFCFENQPVAKCGGTKLGSAFGNIGKVFITPGETHETGKALYVGPQSSLMKIARLGCHPN